MVILKPVLKKTGKFLAAIAIDYCVDRAIDAIRNKWKGGR